MALILVGGSTALWFRRATAVALPRNLSGFVATWVVGFGLGVLALTQG